VQALIAGAPSGPLTIDLETQEITAPDGRVVPFELDPFARECILEGLDEIALTLQREAEIAEYERTHTAPVDTATLLV
jgi:3-isopropylmalate/(R)-2-methylmalate dehydratase small subunit